MFKNFSVKFEVIGKGAEVLKKIKKSYKETAELVKDPLKIKVQDIVKNPFRKVYAFSSDLISRGYRIASVFKTSFLRVERAGISAFSKIGRASTRFLMKFRLMRSISNGFKSFSAYSTKVFEKANKEAGKLRSTIGRIMATLATGLTIKTAFEGASNMEQYRNTLETVLKNPVLAQKKLAWANRFANKTPFETEEVVGGMTKLQAYGMEGDRVLKSTGRTYMEMIGDMAAAMNKPLDQAIEALADSRVGELERLKEFGIKKEMINDFAKLQGYGELVNNRNQIVNIELFNKALFELMDSKYGGAMQKQARTFKGAISTIKGVFKSGLATIAGMDEFGNVIKNSPFQLLRDKVLIPLSETLVKWQEDGTFYKWSEKLASGMEKVVKVGSGIIDFCVKWKEVIIPLTSALAGVFIINKIAFAIGALKASLAALTFNPVMIGIGALIAAGVLLYRNWDKIKEKMGNIFKGIIGGFKAFFGVIKEIFSPVVKVVFGAFKTIFGVIKNIFSSVFNFVGKAFNVFFEVIKNSIEGIKSFFRTLKKFLTSIPVLGKYYDFLFNTIGGAFKVFSGVIKGVKDGIFELFGSIKKLGDKIKKIPFVKKIMTKLHIIDAEENTEDKEETTVKKKVKKIVETEEKGLENKDKSQEKKIFYTPEFSKPELPRTEFSKIDVLDNKNKETENNNIENKDKFIFDVNFELPYKNFEKSEVIKENEKEYTEERIFNNDFHAENNKEVNKYEKDIEKTEVIRENEKTYKEVFNNEKSQKNSEKIIQKKGNSYVLNLTINNNSSEKLDWNKLGDFIIDKIKKYEEEKEVAEGLI